MCDKNLYKARHKISENTVEISRRLVAPEKFTHTIETDENLKLPAQVTLNCSWSPATKKYVIDKMEIEPLSGSHPITSKLLRDVQVGAILEAASRTHLILHARVPTELGTISTTRAMDKFEVRRDELKRNGPSSMETLEWVALIHEIASTEGSRPTQAVSAKFEINIRTASNWVRAARDSGLLDNG